MASFDDIQIYRRDLALAYLQLVLAQPGRPLALFAPRRIGKTFFLQNDLKPAAVAADYVVVYADVWLSRAHPLNAINHALEEVLDDVLVPTSKTGKVAKTEVKKVTIAGSGLEFGEEPKRRPLPEDPALRLDALVGRVAAASGKKILLMLDEIQGLSEVPDAKNVIASLRSVLQTRKSQIGAVFTGSSQEGLAAMMVSAGSPMYQFTQLVTFPTLGDEFLIELQKHYRSVHRGREPLLADLQHAFLKLGSKPELMRDLVKLMSAEGITDVDDGLTRFSKDERQLAGWRALFGSLTPVERAVLYQLSAGKLPLAKDTLAAIDELVPTTAISVSKVRTALESMHKSGILEKPQGAYRISDMLFEAHIAKLDPKSAFL